MDGLEVVLGSEVVPCDALPDRSFTRGSGQARAQDMRRDGTVLSSRVADDHERLAVIFEWYGLALLNGHVANEPWSMLRGRRGLRLGSCSVILS